jgi:hypothetical protein
LFMENCAANVLVSVDNICDTDLLAEFFKVRRTQPWAR